MNGTPYAGDSRVKTFTLPVSGAVRLWGPEIDVVDTPEFQRLGGIKQLGTSYLVFRGAVHTRFEHSLGTLATAQQIIDTVNGNPKVPQQIGADAARLARLAALLHDLPHVPFGHTLEDELHLLERHDRNEARINSLLDGRVAEILRPAIGDAEFEELRRVLRATDDDSIAELRYPFVGDIVANTVCADILDYIRRDLYMCGLPVALGERFLDFMTITPDDVPREIDRQRMALVLEKRGMPRPDVESEVFKLLSYRYELAERVYFHHAKNAASVMIGRAVQALGLDREDSNFHWLSDEMLLAVLSEPATTAAFGLVLPDDRDETLAKSLAEAVSNRRLYKIAYLGVLDDLEDRASNIHAAFGDPEKRKAFEDAVARRAGLHAGEVLVHLPSPRMMEKPVQVRVLADDQTVITLEDWDARHSRRAEALNAAHRRLWRVTVYVPPGTSDVARRLVNAAITEEFRAPSRYVEPADQSLYLEELFRAYRDQENWTFEDWDAVSAAPRNIGEIDSSEDGLQYLRSVIQARRAKDRGEEQGDQGTLPGSDA